jgi:polysaccharide biosynthesis/export protein
LHFLLHIALPSPVKGRIPVRGFGLLIAQMSSSQISRTSGTFMTQYFRSATHSFLGLLLTAQAVVAFAQGSSIKKDECLGNCAPSAVAGDAAAITSSDFKLGIGDVVRVSVWKEPELTGTAVILPDGRISMPLAGDVPIAGKSSVAAQALIRTLLLKYLTDPAVTVSIVEIHSRQVYITGQVQHPGAYPILGDFNVLQLIASAGGLTPYARKKGIMILDAENHQVARFDYASAAKGDPKQSMMLHPGETVVVP